MSSWIHARLFFRFREEEKGERRGSEDNVVGSQVGVGNYNSQEKHSFLFQPPSFSFDIIDAQLRWPVLSKKIFSKYHSCISVRRQHSLSSVLYTRPCNQALLGGWDIEKREGRKKEQYSGTICSPSLSTRIPFCAPPGALTVCAPRRILGLELLRVQAGI